MLKPIDPIGILSTVEMLKKIEAVRSIQDREAKKKAIAEIVPDRKVEKPVPFKRKKMWKTRPSSDVLEGENYNFSIRLSDTSTLEIRDMKNETVDIRVMRNRNGQKFATKSGIMIPLDIWDAFVSAIDEIDIDELQQCHIHKR